jgi:ABC-type transport system involved in cytochrome bd biosynthesis fused ATPase/permease subunit
MLEKRIYIINKVHQEIVLLLIVAFSHLTCYTVETTCAFNLSERIKNRLRKKSLLKVLKLPAK